MRVLYIDPWCQNGTNLFHYSSSLVSAISQNADVEVITPYDCESLSQKNVLHKRLFFLFSNRMKRGKLRTIIRGIEYVYSYLIICIKVLINSYDVVHVEWPLIYRLDSLLFSFIKKHCKLFVLKAHNVLPHATGKKYIEAFRKLYAIADIILLHGIGMKTEFDSLFPESSHKIRIQKHGATLNHNRTYEINSIDIALRNKIEKYRRVYLFCGYIHYDKGVDQLVDFWTNSSLKDNTNSLLIVAGAVSENYLSEFELTESKMRNCDNILFMKGFVDDKVLNFLIDKSNCILLPYRIGSMSGVVFSAAEFSKPLLCTNFGSIRDYIENDKYSFVTSDFDEYKVKLLQIDNEVNDEELEQVGINLHSYIYDNCSWEVIGKRLVNEIYSDS